MSISVRAVEEEQGHLVLGVLISAASNGQSVLFTWGRHELCEEGEQVQGVGSE